ncbi:hypothetical protein [Paenibacillus radicis (ex Xue et al. 2023)]|uniref:Endolytic transglycosylase MltG n=1 Tax=Paenibacillus radicis (ex Xue et al. 2023) TaxID=2972489 RepID=A0ABT1YC59_9BACL|nr:hypothetical protein [Paenibacillus radicis (ex Xue et al. 2023)]MCR8630783.1 hypothetical protein [Paenibacillus radicis (ex Xue et al. 2023)]
MPTNKSLLYGLGTGLIAGAILLQLMNIAASPSKQTGATANPASPAGMDRQQLKDAASKYYQVFENDQKLYTQAQVDTLVQQKLKEEKDKQPAAAGTPPAVKETVKETYILINGGQTAGVVADMLLKSGVITDRAAFEDIMAKQQLNDKIIAGIHVFKGALDLNQVVSIITSR